MSNHLQCYKNLSISQYHQTTIILFSIKNIPLFLLSQYHKNEGFKCENKFPAIWRQNLMMWSLVENWRVPHELFLTKGVPQQISVGFEILRKFFLAWRFLHKVRNTVLIISLFWNTLWEWSIVNCLITCNSFFMIGDWVIFNNLIYAKVVPFLLQAC